MLLTVHDELLFEVQESAHWMRHGPSHQSRLWNRPHYQPLQLSIPLTVDVGHGPSWDDAH